jgi:DNA repair ATPase RecN
MRKTLSVERRIGILEKKIQDTESKIDKYQNEFEAHEITNRRRKQLEANILRNMQSLENFTNELNELTGVTGKMDIPPDSDDEMEETGGAMDSQSQIIKTANNLIYLLREGDLTINKKLFPVARILNPIQKETLRRVYHELRDSLNTIPQIPNAKIDKTLTDTHIITKFLNNFNSIL